eukprot:243294_1
MILHAFSTLLLCGPLLAASPAPKWKYTGDPGTILASSCSCPEGGCYLSLSADFKFIHLRGTKTSRVYLNESTFASSSTDISFSVVVSPNSSKDPVYVSAGRIIIAIDTFHSKVLWKKTVPTWHRLALDQGSRSLFAVTAADPLTQPLPAAQVKKGK